MACCASWDGEAGDGAARRAAATVAPGTGAATGFLAASSQPRPTAVSRIVLAVRSVRRFIPIMVKSRSHPGQRFFAGPVLRVLLPGESLNHRSLPAPPCDKLTSEVISCNADVRQGKDPLGSPSSPFSSRFFFAPLLFPRRKRGVLSRSAKPSKQRWPASCLGTAFLALPLHWSSTASPTGRRGSAWRTWRITPRPLPLRSFVLGPFPNLSLRRRCSSFGSAASWT